MLGASIRDGTNVVVKDIQIMRTNADGTITPVKLERVTNGGNTWFLGKTLIGGTNAAVNIMTAAPATNGVSH